MILENVNLKPYNTFGISSNAKIIYLVNSIDKLKEYSKLTENQEKIILGGGSNMLFTKDVVLPIFKNELKGIHILEKANNEVLIRVAGGENWHHFVQYCIENSYSGIENLSLIPGTVGAGPVQNIGAYGVEIKSVVEKVEAWDFFNKEFLVFSNKDCNFDYRNSIFKQEFKNKLFIHHVVFRLSLNPNPILSYAPVRELIEKEGIKNPSLKEISNIIISIRQSKLPNPEITGNAGSFFKNPTIHEEKFNLLKEKYPSIPNYPQNDKYYKISAAWLIEKAGWKGVNRENCGVHNLQCLVLINLGKSTGNEILQLSQDIIDDIYDKFDIVLEREVNIL